MLLGQLVQAEAPGASPRCPWGNGNKVATPLTSQVQVKRHSHLEHVKIRTFADVSDEDSCGHFELRTVGRCLVIWLVRPFFGTDFYYLFLMMFVCLN